MYMAVRACVRECVRACVRLCVRACIASRIEFDKFCTAGSIASTILRQVITQSTTHQWSRVDGDELACRQLSRRGVASGTVHSCPLQHLLTVNTAVSHGAFHCSV